SAGSTTIAARSTVEFLGTVIREVPPRATPIQFLRELEKRLRVKHRIHITACHLRSAIHSKFRNLGNSIPIKRADRMSGRESTGRGSTSGDSWNSWSKKSPSRSKVPSDVQQKAISRSSSCPDIVINIYSRGSEGGGGRRGGHWARSISSEFPIQIEAPIKRYFENWDRGLISRRRPWPRGLLDERQRRNIVNWSAGIAISPLSYYRCCDNLYQVRTIVDHQIRWSAIFTPAPQAQILGAEYNPKKVLKDSNIVNKEGGPRPLQSSQRHRAWEARIRSRSNSNEHSTTSKRGES
ncbi:hypothetical protein HAX54_021501, partial [Datura stramonium]|nr:hypothetical protein [Datura stramonium]